MTRTTRKMTGKTPWAAALTALVAVLALVFGAMAFAGVANAKDNGNGNGNDNPGNSQNAPGHQADATHGNSDGTPGGGNDNNNPNDLKKVWVCHADTNNNGDAGLADGTGGEFKKGYNLIYISVNAWLNGHDVRHPDDHAFATEALALDFCGPVTPPITCPDGTAKAGTELTSDYVVGEVPDRCNTTENKTVAKDLCDLNAVPPKMVTFPDITATAYTDALKDAQATTHVRYALTCPITDEQAAAIDAALATVAPEPATVAPVEAATVPVPATAKPLPATIPAGDGSSVPTVPVYVLALLALGATALAGSAVRLAVRRNG